MKKMKMDTACTTKAMRLSRQQASHPIMTIGRKHTIFEAWGNGFTVIECKAHKVSRWTLYQICCPNVYKIKCVDCDAKL